MGIKVEFNSNIELRRPKTPGRLEGECVPNNIARGKFFEFIKKGQRIYWIGGEIPLVMTEGGEKLSRPVASVKIVEYTHFKKDGEVYTRGLYFVKEVYDIDDLTIHFERMEKVK